MVAKKKDQVPVKPSPGALANIEDYDAFAGMGMDDIGAADCVIPMLALLQSNSKAVSKAAPEYVKGAEGGMLMQSVSRELFPALESESDGVIIVPVHRTHKYVEWVDRKKKPEGGFVGVHDVESDIVRAAKMRATSLVLPGTREDTQLVETFYLTCMLLDDVDATEFSQLVVVPFASTKISTYKKAMTRLRMLKGSAKLPLFVHRLRLQSIPDKKHGQDYFTFKMSFAVDDSVEASMIPAKLDGETHPLLLAGRGAHEMMASGERTIDHAQEADGGTGETPF